MTGLELFDHQVQHLLHLGYPEAAGVSTDSFLVQSNVLRAQLPDQIVTTVDLEQGTLPFVIVVKSALVPTETQMSLTQKDGKHGMTKLFPHEPQDFSTIDSVKVPSSNIYLLIDINRGKETINLPPSEAMGLITASGRSPLTIEEGIALVTQFPEFLMKNNCFSLLASRHEGDQRVPAIWINANKQPNLGWCWNGNPHTWLGSASCAQRIG